MPQSLTKIYIHCVFGTKNRANLIRKEDFNKVYKYIAGIINSLNGHAIEIGGTTNHIHILATLPKTLSTSKFINQIKSSSSKWIKTIDPHYTSFKWQNGYGAFSVSSSKIQPVQAYIQNQEAHHKQITYQEEVVSFLKQYKIEYNEEYLWD
jgi:REP element-mobilizing transposase RayT